MGYLIAITRSLYLTRLLLERQRAQAAVIAQRSALLQKIAASTQDIITIHRPDTGDIVYASEAGERRLGIAPDLKTARPVADTQILPEDLVQFENAIDLARHGREGRCTVRAVDTDGQRLWLEGVATGVASDDAGYITDIVCVLRDVTTQVLHEAELRRARDEAESSNAAKSRFLAQMSHELRTPLNAIIGFSEIMSQGMLGHLGNKRYEEYARAINESGQHLLSLINDILDMSKIEAGKYSLKLGVIDVATICQESIRFVQLRAEAGAIRVRLTLEHITPPAIYADARAIKQVLLNLLSNASKAMPDGGEIAIRTLTEDHPDGPVLVLVVEDTGCGMPDDFVARLGEPFVELPDRTAHRTRVGTGLGIAISKSLVEMHSGEMLIESTLDVGTTVTLRLPYVPPCAVISEDGNVTVVELEPSPTGDVPAVDMAPRTGIAKSIAA